MSSNPLVSIIIPTYNSEKFLVRCLDSVSKQTYKNIEIIIVDNNSTDNTKEIAKKYTDNVFNRGPERSSQTNYGVLQAKGEYVYKVDSDFVLDSTVVEECVSKIQEGFEAIVVHNSPDTRISWIAKIRKFEVDMYKYDITHSAARFLKKEVYEAIGGNNEKITAAEDYDFQNKLNKNGYQTGFVDAEALHLGEPTDILAHMKKFYWYGKDMVKYYESNSDKPKEQQTILNSIGDLVSKKDTTGKQIGFFRTVYFKHWKSFLFHPILGISFILYNICKYLFGGIGFLVGKLN
jgi:glycosyltransferase involved in cell wall biosynthesis